MSEEDRKEADYTPLFGLLDIDRKTAELIAKNSTAAKKRYGLFRHDIAAFMRYYFPDYITLEPAGFQKAIFSILENPFRDRNGRWKWRVTKEQAERLAAFHRPEFRHLPRELDVLRCIALCAPRETGKSTIFARLVVIWLVIYDYIRFTAYFRANSDLAERFLADTMLEFESNERLIRDFGNMRGPIWNTKMYSLKNGAVFIAVGKDSNIRGLVHRNLRPDLIILDDLVSEKEKSSPRVLESIYDWLTSAVFGLSKNALMLYLNTIYNELDPMYTIQQRIEEGTLPRFLALRFSAEIEDGIALWPELWPIEDLRAKKMEVGSDAFAVEYMSIITGGKDKILPKAIFQWKPGTQIDAAEYDIHLGIDPNAEGTDDAAIAVVGKHWHTGRYLTLDAWCRDNATITELVDQMVRWWQKYQPSMIAWEQVSFQKVYQKLLQEILMAEGLNLPLIGVDARGSKETRATALEPFIENGSWEHSEMLRDSDFFMKIYRFPTKGLNDGPVDAMSLAYLSFNRTLGSPAGSSSRRPSQLPGLIGRYRNAY